MMKKNLEHDLIKALKEDRSDNNVLALLKDSPDLAKIKWEAEKDVLKGSTPLHYAAHYNLVKSCDMLLENGADIEARTEEWYKTPLSWAADYASNEALAFLIDKGANINADIGHGYIALHAAAAGGQKNGAGNAEGYIKAAKLLIDAGSDINQKENKFGKTPLGIAVEYKNKAVEDYLRSLEAK